MKDNRSSNQNKNGRQQNAPSDWEASSRWFDERQNRITTGAYSQSQQRTQPQQNSRPAPQRQQSGGANRRGIPETKQVEKRQNTKTESKKEKKRNDKERQKFNRYYSKNKNSGKSKDELRKEFAAHAKRKRKRKVFEALFFTFLIAVGVFIALSLTVLFKIETISVIGDTRYSQEQVIEAAQVKAGDNLWLTTSGKLTDKASVALPYIKTVKVKRTVPSDVVLEVLETTPKYSVKNGKKYVLIDDGGKVLETAAKKKGDTTEITGVEFGEFIPGMPVNTVSQENYELAMEIIDYADGSGIRLTQIDVTNVNLITAIYNAKIRLEFGAGTDLETKVKMAREIIKTLKEEKNTQEGVINLKSVTKAFFREEALNPTEAPTTIQPSSDGTTDTTSVSIADTTEGTTASTTENTAD